MKKINDIRMWLDNEKAKKQLSYIYSCDEYGIKEQKKRITALLDKFSVFSPESESAAIYSAPGRTEIGGNHTDHQKGCVLAAAVTLDAIAVASPNGTNIIRIDSEGYPPFEVDVSNILPNPTGDVKPSDVVLGIADAVSKKGYVPKGFDACIESQVPGGSGLSSSACFEVLIAAIFNDICCGGEITALDMALAGKHAENVFSGKPSGLLDQATIAFGGLVSMDFSLDKPVLESLKYDFEENGYALCVVNTGGSHADLSEDYASIPMDMKKVASYFGREVLSEVDEEEFWRQIGALKNKVGGRAVLRAVHYFDETVRALEQAKALKNDEIHRFLCLVNESGRSSENCLQNINPTKNDECNISIALEFARRNLDGLGAYRVHGGGFAGTIQAYVPLDMYDSFEASMEMVFGKGCCLRIKVRPVGGIKFDI